MISHPQPDWRARLFPVFGKIPGWVKQHWRAFMPLVTVFLLPNLVFIVARLFLPTRRSWISIDYLAFAFFFCWYRKKKILGAVMLLLFALDVVYAFSGIYYFDVGMALRYMKDLREVSPSLVVPIFLLLAAMAGAITWAACAVDCRQEKRGAFWILAVALAFILPIWVARGMITHAWIGTHPDALVGSSLANSLAESMAIFAPITGEAATPSAIYSRGLKLAGANGPSPRNMLQIEAESLGVLLNANDNRALLAPLASPEIKARYNVIFGTVPFMGATVSGEMRELCGTNRDPGDFPESALRQCLPWKFQKAGYRTIAVHGFTTRMFDREHWFRLIGFQELIFREQLQARLPRVCGSAFAGNCDTDVANYIGNLISTRRNQKLFIHWMTLTAHLPVDDQTASSSRFPCDQYDSTRQSHEVCDVVRVQFETNEAIARLVLKKDLPPTVIVVVGDHAPPLVTLQSRKLFLQDRVPFVVFEPKSAMALAAERSPQQAN